MLYFILNSDFNCNCTYPRYAPTRVDPFTGKYCQYHNELNGQCVESDSQQGQASRRICKNGADCRLVFFTFFSHDILKKDFLFVFK